MIVHARQDERSPEIKVGFVVSRAVGGAVTRNRVKRRLRHLFNPRVGALPPGVRLVVRALPPAALAPANALAGDLDSCLDRLLRVAA